MKKKISLVFLFLSCVSPLIGFATDQSQIAKVAQITGVSSSKVAKMAEAIDTMAEARRYARAKNFEKAIQLLSIITTANGFKYDDERFARMTIADVRVLSGDYEKAYEITLELNKERALLDDYLNFMKAMADFSSNKDPGMLLAYIENYNSKNKTVIPPKSYGLNYLSRTVRFFEMAGEIDQALDLVDQYFSEKSLKFHQREKTREGLRLLKEALLRDKREGKNVYAQGLINTTDYFGFV